MRTPVGEPSVWRGYKAICLHEHNSIAASFQENTLLTDWVNQQNLAPIITGLGDGHDGVWNIFKEVATSDSRREILDWYHLTEQVCSIGSGSIESTIKRSSSERVSRSWNEPKQQIDRRTQISGAQWKSENIPQVLAHRCAYLNGLICDRLAARLRSR